MRLAKETCKRNNAACVTIIVQQSELVWNRLLIEWGNRPVSSLCGLGVLRRRAILLLLQSVKIGLGLDSPETGDSRSNGTDEAKNRVRSWCGNHCCLTY